MVELAIAAVAAWVAVEFWRSYRSFKARERRFLDENSERDPR